MNAQARNEITKTKKLISSQQQNSNATKTTNNKQDTPTKVKPAVAYDYDAAVSQPDVPNFLGQKYNTSLSIRKKGFYSRGKSKPSIRKTAPTGSTDTAGSKMAKSQDKENEVRMEGAKDSKIDSDHAQESDDVSHAEEEMARNEITAVNNESPSIFSKTDPLKNNAQERDRRKLCSEEKDKIEENVGSLTPRSSSLQRKDSKIPRTKGATSPAVIHVSRNDSVKRLSLTGPQRSLDAITNKKDARRENLKKQTQSKFVSSKQQSPDTPRARRHERNDETIITETSPAVMSSASDPSAFVVLKGLKENHDYRSCDDYNPESSYQEVEDTLSDSRSSPERRYVPKKCRRSLKHRKYIDTSSDDFDVSSDYSSQSSEKKTSNNAVAPEKKSSSVVKSSTRSRNRRGSSFSFFNTLFDIVFWPFLFLKSDR